MPRSVAVLVCVVLLELSSLRLQAQAPLPSVDAVARSMAMSQAQGIRLMGMGGIVASVADTGNIRNPAAMVKLPDGAEPGKPFFATSYGGTTISPTAARPNGMRFNVRATTVGLGDGSTQVLAARVARVSSPRSQGIITVGGAPTLIDQDLGYDTFLLGYARKLSDRLYASVMLAGGDTKATIYAPGTAVPIGQLYADPDPGFEAAVYYELGDKMAVGGVWTTIRGVETSMIAGLPPVSRLLKSNIYRIGVSCRPDERTTCAAEWGGLSFKDRTNNLSTDDSRFYFGAERWITPELAVRAGSFGGQMSLGVGAKLRGVSLDYAYVKDLNKKSNGKLFPAVPAATSRTNYFAVSASF